MSANLENSTVPTEMEKVSFQSNLKEEQSQRRFKLYNFIHFMLARLCSKSFKLGFSNTRTENFQVYKLDLEKGQGPEIKLPTSTASQKKHENAPPKNIYFCFTDYAKAFDCVDHNKLWKILTDQLTCLLRNLYAGQEATVRTGHETTGVRQGCILSPCLFNFCAEYIM